MHVPTSFALPGPTKGTSLTVEYFTVFSRFDFSQWADISWSYLLLHTFLDTQVLAGLPAVVIVGCLRSQLHASVSQGRICSDYFTCCHSEIEVADQTFHLTQSRYTDTGPTSPISDPITPGAWQGSHCVVNQAV